MKHYCEECGHECDCKHTLARHMCSGCEEYEYMLSHCSFCGKHSSLVGDIGHYYYRRPPYNDVYLCDGCYDENKEFYE